MKLWLLRHARAEQHSESGRDIDRPLSASGITACRHLNAWLRERASSLPASARVSPSHRTRETAEKVLDGLKVRQVIDENLWLASAGQLHDQIERAGRSDALWLIGHNPGLESLISMLGAAIPTPGLKPGTLVVLDLAEQRAAKILHWIAPIESR